jgi:hypothetical protein
VQDYVRHLSALRDDDGRPVLASSSIARALVAVRSFHGFCAEEGLLPTDPSEEVDAPRVPQGIPKALDESQVELLLGAVGGPRGDAAVGGGDGFSLPDRPGDAEERRHVSSADGIGAGRDGGVGEIPRAGHAVHEPLRSGDR